MRVIVMVKGNEMSEAGTPPDQKLIDDMTKFNEELVKAGIMLAGEGLHPTAKGKKIRYKGTKRTVIDGPFTESKELIAGFWIWQVKSMEEAVEWAKKSPNPFPGESEVEIRQVMEAEDFGPEFTPEAREREDRLRKKIANSTRKSTRK